MSKNSLQKQKNCTAQGELEGAKPASNPIECPRTALLRKACGSQSEDFHTAEQWESNGISGCEKV